MTFYWRGFFTSNGTSYFLYIMDIFLVVPYLDSNKKDKYKYKIVQQAYNDNSGTNRNKYPEER